jgi:hypothetical protein
VGGAVVRAAVCLDLHDPADASHTGRLAHEERPEETPGSLDDPAVEEGPEARVVAQV